MRVIKTIFLCFLCSFFILEASIGEKNISEYDGTDWLNSSESFRVGYVTGFISSTIVAREYINIFRSSFKEVEKLVFDTYWDEISLYNITMGQIQDGIDTFYKDFSNRRIKIVDAIFIVKMQIQGENPTLIDAQIRHLKIQPIEPSALAGSWKRLEDFKREKERYPTYIEIKNGDFSFEDLLNYGKFIDENNNLHHLFCYGKYNK